jgi:hypothetical protein
MDEVIPRVELKRIIKAFMMDKRRGIPLSLFAELCGMDRTHLYNIFISESHPLTETMQRRISKGYCSWRDGKIIVLERYGKKWIEYRKEPKKRAARGYGLQIKDGEVRLKLGIKNRLDYSDYSIDEQLKGI